MEIDNELNMWGLKCGRDKEGEGRQTKGNKNLISLCL